MVASSGNVTPLGNLGVNLIGDASAFEKMLEKAEKDVDKFSFKTLKKIGDGFAKYVTAPIAAMAGASVKSFTTFDDAITQASSRMAGVTGKLRAEMIRTALTASEQGNNSAIELAGAYEGLADAGYNAERAIKALGVVENFSDANTISVKESVKQLTDTQRVLGLESKNATVNMANMTRISDVLTLASTRSGASVEDLSSALEHQAGTAMRKYGVSLEQGVAVLATLNQQGIKGAKAGALFAQIIEGAKGGAKSQEALETLRLMRERTNAFADALSKASGTTAGIANERMNELGNQFKNLKNRIEVAAIEIGAIMEPYMRKLIKTVVSGIEWFKALNQSTKEYAVLVALVAASIGPLILGFIAVAKTVLLIYSYFTLATLGTIAWVAVIGAVIAAVVLLTDAILQMTGTGNLGILDMVEKFRIGGFKISTWLTSAFVIIGGAFDSLANDIVTGWKTVVFEVMDLGSFLYRELLGVWQGIAEGFYKVQYALHLITPDEFTAKMLNSQAEFNKSINSSLEEAEKRYQEYYADLDAQSKEHAARQKDYDDTVARLFKKDSDERTKEMATAASKASGGSLYGTEVKIPGFTLPEFKLPSTEDLKAKKEAEKFIGGFQDPKKAGGEFMVQSLKRFDISGRAGSLATKPEVKVPGVETRLDKIIELTANKGPVGPGLVGE